MEYSTLVTREVLADHLDDPDWIVFDCRFDLSNPDKGRQDYAGGHAPGARYAHLDHDLSAPKTAHSGRHPLPDPDRFVAWLRDNGVSNHTQVVVYDDMAGAIAARLWWMLKHWLGHTRTAVLDGSWPCWENAGLPVEDIMPSPRRGDFQGRPNPEVLIETEALVEALASGEWKLLDGRLPARFKGEQEPLDPVAGHIPGALNQPFTANLANGHMQNPQTIRHHLDYVLGGHPIGRTICMCGSGVTACHNILAMDYAGLPVARLYVGSWSEWITDPARPVAVAA